MEETLKETINRHKNNNKEFIVEETIKIFYESTEDTVKLKALEILQNIG
ncbi:hypothetical protein ACLD43_15390 [Clostridium botulinum]|nr:hypothetical protein [Clostridium botulinum]